MTKAKATKADALAGLLSALSEAGDRAVLDGTKLSQPTALSARRLAKLKLPNGKPVGGSLARWVAYSHDWLELVDVLPKTASGKVQKHLLRTRIRERQRETLGLDRLMAWDEAIKAQLAEQCVIIESVDELLQRLQQDLQTGDQVVMMSNGGFENAPRRLFELLND